MSESASCVTVVNANLFEIESQTLVNTVNCVGIMGKGIALEFKRAYPNMFADYAKRCRRKEVRPGVPYLYIDASGKRIINFPTKYHWRNGSQIEWIVAGLEYIAGHAKVWEITSLALTPPGCGNGGLEWCMVYPFVESILGRMRIPVYVCMKK